MIPFDSHICEIFTTAVTNGSQCLKSIFHGSSQFFFYLFESNFKFSTILNNQEKGENQEK